MKNKIAILVTFLASSFAGQLFSQGAYIPPDKPKLVVGIVIEQFRYDYIDRFWDNFSEGGFKRLINEGTNCKNASYDFFFTQSGPAHATLATGTDPRTHGIVADNWYHPLRDEIIFCTADRGVNPVGGSFENGLHSPQNLLPSTFGDELKLSNGGTSKVFSLGMNVHTAVLSGGHSANAAYWYDDVTGGWMTSTHYIDSLPSWVKVFNGKNLPDTYLNQVWTPLLPSAAYRGCLPDTNNYETGLMGRSVFPYDLKSMSGGARLQLLNRKRDYTILPQVPAGNTYTADFAITLIESEDLGSDEITDFLSINFSVLDNIGHAFGPSSLEMADAVIRLDRDLEHFINYLVDKLGKKNVLIYITSAHGVAESPSLLTDKKIPSGHFKYNQALTLLKSYLNVLYGQGNRVKGYYEQQVYLNRTLIEDAKLSLTEVQDVTARFLTQFTGVAFAVPANVIESNDFSRGHYRMMRNSYDPVRSGDVILNLRPAWVENGKYVTNHNSPYEYDAHVPLIWYGWTVNRSSVTRRVNMNEVAATLSSLCKVQVPNASTGEPMTELFR